MLRNLNLPIIALLLLAGCSKSGTIRENELVNRWIHEVMERNYLWASEMPGVEQLYWESHPEIFFKRLLYKIEDDIDRSDVYSEIAYIGDEEFYPAYDNNTEVGAVSRSYHFGFEYRKVEGPLNFVQVLYVFPGSPADKAGIKRGDCFQVINGTNVKDYIPTAFRAYYDAQINARIEFMYPEEKTVTLRREYYNDNPVHFDTIYNLTPVTGYFVYNHFTDGNSDSYYKELQNVFARFHTAGVENIIADFRYNGGGELTAARKMCSLLAPPAALGNPFLYKEYNSSYGDPDNFTAENLLSPSQVNGYNCGNISLYIITGKNTASASELVVHCLRPLYDNEGLKFVQLGETTKGKNLGGQTFSNERYDWLLTPITLRVYNTDKVSGYESGLIPDISEDVDKADRVQAPSGEYVLPLGEWGKIEEDRMLTLAMNDIYGYGGWAVYDPGGGTRAKTTRSTALPAGLRIENSVKARGLIEKRTPGR